MPIGVSTPGIMFNGSLGKGIMHEGKHQGEEDLTIDVTAISFPF